MWKDYGSALNSYLMFICMHNLPVELTSDILSFYTVYMCYHINPNSINTYLSGICHQLKSYFPNIWEIQKAHLVHHTLEGCKQLQGTPTVYKWALTIVDLNTICVAYSSQPMHDNLLFCTQLCIGFFALMWLGELTWPNKRELFGLQKLTTHNSVALNESTLWFFLPGHKANRFFKENIIILCTNPFPCNPLPLFCAYLCSCDCLFPLFSPLWLIANGAVLTRTFFMYYLHFFFDNDISGQSMRVQEVPLLWLKMELHHTSFKELDAGLLLHGKFTFTNILFFFKLCCMPDSSTSPITHDEAPTEVHTHTWVHMSVALLSSLLSASSNVVLSWHLPASQLYF
jgi:hypothetical protein